MKNRIFKVEKLAHGGMGIVRDVSHAVFVPFVIPGEEISIRIEGGSRKPVRAELVKVVSPSPDRVKPPCPLFGECGGCQIQHISYPAQLKHKTEILTEILAWIAKIRPQVNPFAPSLKQYNYRSRIRMHVRRGVAGFFARQKKKLVPVKYCYISHDTINQAIPSLASLIGMENPESIELIHQTDSVAAIVESRRESAIYRMLIKDRAGIGKWTPAPELKVAFQQVNPEQNEALRALVGKVVHDLKVESVIELYAGSGNLTEVIWQHTSQVIAIDTEKEAVDLANERFGKIENGRLRFIRAKADAFLDTAIEKGMKPDLIVLDPPRTGAKESIPGILRLKPGHIIYVSCDPATLARDIKTMLSEGYRLKSITPIDMFPQTSHIETVVVLSK